MSLSPRFVFAITLVCATPALAQEPAPPAKELAKLERLIGAWEGSGTVVEAAGMDPSPWTCFTTTKKVMGGHFLREDTIIDIGEGMPPLCFTTFLGWDRENSRFVSLAAGNTGDASFEEIVFADDDTMVQFARSYPDGKLTVERWRTTLGQDEYSFAGDQATLADRPFTHVRGTMKRAQTVEASTTGRGAFIGVEAGDEMKRLAKLNGTYQVTGSMRMTADAPAIEISGTQTMKPIFGGTVLEMATVGKPNYEAWGAISWDAHANAYRLVYVNNMGEAGTNLLHWVDNALVGNMSGKMMGQPSSRRTVMPCNQRGHMIGATTHVLHAADAPFEAMKLTYERQ